MKNILASLATAFFCFAPGFALAVPSKILVPGGTAIPIHVIGTISSSSVKDGDTFQFQAAQNVAVDGMVVIRSGALGSGTIGAVDRAGGNGHSGGLTLNCDWIYAVDGGKIHLAQAAQRQAEEDRKGASSTATIIGFATFGIGGLFGHNLAHGREVTVDGNKTLSAFVANNVHVLANETAEDSDHFDR